MEEFESQLTRIELRRTGYLQSMSTILGRRVWENAGSPEVDTNRLMVSIGTGLGSAEELVFGYDEMRTRGYRAISPLAVQKYMPNGAAAAVGLERHAKAGVMTPISACASGSEGIARAWQQIVLGEADVAICGGVETKIEAVPIAGFSNMRIVMSTNNDDPAGACRPFDKNRDGFVFGEGGALMVIETEETRQGPWRQHPGPDHGGQHHLGRFPHGGAGSQRRTRRPRDDAGDTSSRICPHRHRSRQRPRHRHPGR